MLKQQNDEGLGAKEMLDNIEKDLKKDDVLGNPACDIYLAGPGFSESEKAIINLLEDKLEKAGFKVFSPFRDAGIVKQDKSNSKEIFRKNVEAIDFATLMFANIEGLDPGTIFELGYAYATGTNIIMWSPNPDRKLNIMLLEACDSYYAGMDRIDKAIEKANLIILHPIDEWERHVDHLDELEVE